jgi:dienelactone hydrolase
VTRVATTRDESRLLIPCGDAVLSAVATRPTTDANGTGIIFFAGRWSVTSIGRSRLFVHMARHMAALGFYSLRLDLLGLGESTGEEREWQLHKPFVEEPAAAQKWLDQQGVDDVILIGTCGGARLALSSTPNFERLRGAVLFAPPVRDYAKGDRTATLPTSEFVKRALSKKVLTGLGDKRARNRYLHHARGKLRRMVGGQKARPVTDGPQPGFAWVSDTFLDPLQALVQRGVPVLLFFGEHDSYYDDFVRGRSGRLGKILEKGAELITLVVVPGRFHGLPQADLQREAMEAVEAWLPKLGTASRASARASAVAAD